VHLCTDMPWRENTTPKKIEPGGGACSSTEERILFNMADKNHERNRAVWNGQRAGQKKSKVTKRTLRAGEILEAKIQVMKPVAALREQKSGRCSLAYEWKSECKTEMKQALARRTTVEARLTQTSTDLSSRNNFAPGN
jgi:hypothetical protein